ncbi:MAG: hypothetical protein JXR14_02950 [Paracoccaceae bacterium]
MPHAELKYSNDLAIDAQAILAKIEETIHSHDSGSGACKGRAYPADIFHHTHLIVEISMLTKPHRDAAFTDALVSDLEAAIKSFVSQSCHFSLSLDYSTGAYVTNLHAP